MAGYTNGYTSFFIKRFTRMLFLLLVVSIVSFFLLSMSPVDPLNSNVGQAALGSMSKEQVEKLKEYWGVGVPVTKRFMSWLSGLLHGDLGISLLYRRPVVSVIGDKFLSSAWLMVFAWLFSGILGVGLGLLAGIKKEKWQDKAITGYCMVIAGTPAFWLGLLLLIVFAVQFPILPIGFSVPIGVEAAGVTWTKRLSHAVLPALTLGITGASGLAMHTRAKVIEVMESDYIFYARARGEGTMGLVLRHVLRNVALPILTLQFASVSEILGGSVLVEQVFSYPGLGQAAVTAGIGSDVPLLLGITLLSTVVVFAGNFMADLLYMVVDPRMRRSNMKKDAKRGRG